MTRMLPTRSGKMVEVGTTREVEGGVMGFVADYDRRSRQVVATLVFVPTA